MVHNISYVLFDTAASRSLLYPFSITRPLAHLWLGGCTLQQWWQQYIQAPVHYLTEGYLQWQPAPSQGPYILIDATVIPNKAIATQISQLMPGETLEDEHGIIAFGAEALPVFNQLPVWSNSRVTVANQTRLTHASSLWQLNQQALSQQAAWLTHGWPLQQAHDSNRVWGHALYVHEHAQVQGCMINTSTGPVIIANGALVMEGTCIRGPVYIGEGAVVKMGATLYGATTVGPYCVAGGEIKNSLIYPYSNKAHHGYLGDSVVGSWCNLGAGTTNSNIKNTASPVKVWHQNSQSFLPIGTKAGLLMGDFCQTAINTSLNTGSTVGVSVSLHGQGFPPKHVPSFTWGFQEPYALQQALANIQNWMSLKGQELSPVMRQMLIHLYHQSQV